MEKQGQSGLPGNDPVRAPTLRSWLVLEMANLGLTLWLRH